MARTSADIAYEQNELAAQLLVDRCDVRVYSFAADAGGGRTLNDPPTVYSNQACRLESDKSGIERNDSLGELIVTDYVVQMSPTNSVPEGSLAGNAGNYVEVKVTSINGAAVARYFRIVSYGAVSEMGMRALYVREILT
jgi:hypothetical protein